MKGCGKDESSSVKIPFPSRSRDKSVRILRSCCSHGKRTSLNSSRNLREARHLFHSEAHVSPPTAASSLPAVIHLWAGLPAIRYSQGQVQRSKGPLWGLLRSGRPHVAFGSFSRHVRLQSAPLELTPKSALARRSCFSNAGGSCRLA